MNKPYLLAPCGSFDAVLAAISAGADECYFGGSGLNARMNAKGFTEEEFFNALRLLRIHGVRSNITLNTLNFDRELPATVDFAKKAYENGADAFIVQDTGLAKMLYEAIPDIELHASTQCACHNLEGAVQLSKLGFSRIVLARELPLEDIKDITEYGRKTGMFQTEVFVHGALCVCHSGMCLMSSVIGSRSGNRGLCAQPCRMPGNVNNNTGTNGRNNYPLSLRDLTLSKHITELLPLGIASLKIEGRMKSPDYVYRTVKILRELIDSNADATDKQYNDLLDIFSRGGFTDGYFTKKYLSDNRRMYGIRRESDKVKTAMTDIVIPELPKIPVKLYTSIKKDQKPYARFEAYGKYIGEATLPEPAQPAANAPLTSDGLLKNMSKLGSTQFVLESFEKDLDDGLFLTASAINTLRREAVESLEKAMMSDRSGNVSGKREQGIDIQTEKRSCKSPKLRFFTDNPDFKHDKAKYPEELESICLPLELFVKDKTEICVPFGVRLPRVIFGAENYNIRKALIKAKDSGALYIYVSNIGHTDLAKETGLPIYGGMGLNITNSQSLVQYAAMGFESLCLSSELNTAQMRDILRAKGVKCSAVVQGRLPLMVLESCILRASGICSNYNKASRYCGEYTDRIGKRFPIYPEKRFTDENDPCRNIIMNADILDLYSKKDEIAKCGADILEIISEQ